MGQEFFIKSSDLEAKIRQLLPSQGGAGAGFDLSASTQIIPIVDLTESAEGSNVRQDLQTAFTYANTTFNSVTNTTTTLISNTGFWRLFGSFSLAVGTAAQGAQIFLDDGVTQKPISNFSCPAVTATAQIMSLPFDFVVNLQAGISVKAFTSSNNAQCNVAYRQIADIEGNLITI